MIHPCCLALLSLIIYALEYLEVVFVRKNVHFAQVENYLLEGEKRGRDDRM